MKKLYLCIDSFRHASRRTANQGGTFALYTMIYSKTPLDYNSIIEMMKSRGLIIADEQKLSITSR